MQPHRTPTLLTDSNGSVVWSAQYAPFGDAIIDEDPDGDGRGVTFNLRFPGQYYDAESELHYNWHRYYDPETGRYITADPTGLAGGINQYAYVGGNPVNKLDITGLISGSILGDDCRLMEGQEESSKGLSWAFWARGRVCAQALLTCQKNCKSAEVDETSCNRKWDTDRCLKQCREAVDKCRKGDQFKRPQILKDKFGCGK